MAWTVHLYVVIAKVPPVSIPLHLRLKVMRTTDASVGITKKVSLTESEKYYNMLHIHDRSNVYLC